MYIKCNVFSVLNKILQCNILLYIFKNKKQNIKLFLRFYNLRIVTKIKILNFS